MGDNLAKAPSQEERTKLIAEFEKSMDKLFKGKPYMVSVTVMEDYNVDKEKKISASFSGLNRMGNIDATETPFQKINTLIQAFIKNSSTYSKSIYKGPNSEGE